MSQLHLYALEVRDLLIQKGSRRVPEQMQTRSPAFHRDTGPFHRRVKNILPENLTVPTENPVGLGTVELTRIVI
jgi:hypothetical protein